MERSGISVLINNYNYGGFVRYAIESALDQQFADAEIIVVDDGSTDESRLVLEAFGGRIKVLFQENRGQAAAMNAAVRMSQGDILCFLDADDWWAPGKLEATAAAFRSNPDVALVYHRLQPALRAGSPTLKPIPRTLCSGNLAPQLVRSAGWWPFPMTSALAVRRSAWAVAGDIPERFRISADGWLAGIYPFLGDVAALPDSLGFYRIHNNNWYRESDDAAMARKRIAHWRAIVDVTNQFLSDQGYPERLSLSDHFPYRTASASLAGVDALTRLRLATEGLMFAGEPNLLRRMRDTLRMVCRLPRQGLDVPLSEAVE